MSGVATEPVSRRRRGALRWARDTGLVVGFRLGWSAVRRLPEPAAYRLLLAIADRAARRNGPGVQRLRANYARVRPELPPAELDALVREGMRSYLRYYCEAFRLPTYDSDRLAEVLVMRNDAQVRRYLDAGSSVVVFIGHMGNWDLAGAWSTGHLAPVTTVAERLEPEELFQGFLEFRQSLGITILPLTGGENPFTGLRRAVASNQFIALPADRDLTRGGVEVDFCGHRARMAKGPAALAVLTGAPLFAAAIFYEDAQPGHGTGGKHVVVEMSDEIPRSQASREADRIAEMTQACARYLEPAIRAHTEDWHMMQRVFVDDLDPARLPRT